MLRPALLVLVTLAGCGSTGAARPATAVPWQRLEPSPGVALYAYGETIDRYAPDDRGAYVVRLAGAPEARRTAADAIGGGDDVVGDDGYVLRLDATGAATLATRDGVVAVTPLQPADRRGVLIDRGTELPEVRIELFADATAAETEAVAAWVSWRGGQVLWRGRTALRARLPHEARDEAGRLSVVRWIE